MISLNTLRGRWALASLAAVALSGLGLAAHADQPPKPSYFTFGSKAPTIHEDNIADIHVLVTAVQSLGRQSVLESNWGPDFKVRSHFHKHHAETFITLSGHVEWTIGGETHVTGAGDAVHIPPGTVHSVRVVDGQPAHMIFISEPGGYEDADALEAALTPAVRADKELMKHIEAMIDFNPTEPKP